MPQLPGAPMQADDFDTIIDATIAALPPHIRRHLDRVTFQVAVKPSREQRRGLRLRPWETIYGLYEGVPLTERAGADVVMPDVITIFRRPLERDFPDPTERREQIRQTVLHELAHYFGIDDDRLIELDAY